MNSKVKNSVISKAGSTLKQHSVSKLSSEPYKCSGKFKDDFDNICTSKNYKYIPDVVSRSKRPGSAVQNVLLNQQVSQESVVKLDKKVNSTSKSKTTSTTIESDHDNEQQQVSESQDLPPKSFVFKDSSEYFKPKIHVEMDNPDKLDTVTEIHVKGWKLEKPIIEVLSVCLPAIDQLHTLNLWNSGLDEECVRLISAMLPNCTNLKNLILDGNPLRSNGYQVLLYEENSNVQHLSLRNNLIDDNQVKYLSLGLGDIRRQNSKLLTLNLSNNLIGDDGAVSLARGLRTNRSLIVLNLSNNNIGDVGAKAFAEAISRFALTLDEIIHRRYVMSERSFIDKNTDLKDNRPNSQKSTINYQSSSDPKLKKDKTSKKSGEEKASTAGTNNAASQAQKNAKDSIAKPKKDDKTARKASLSVESKSKLKRPSSKTGKRAIKEVEEVNTALLEISPLTDIAEYVDDTLWLVGNRSLISLNLSRNNLTDISINRFILAMQYQKTIVEVHKNQGLGLVRLILTRNSFSSESEAIMHKLNEILKQRDPFLKLNSTSNLDAETGSLSSASLARPSTKSGIKH